MPEYLFTNVNNPKQTCFRFYSMKDAPSVGTVIEDPDTGVKWKRAFTKPQMGVDTVNIDPFSGKDFVKATNKRDSLGALWERSAEMGDRRAAKEGGIDPIKESFYREYSKKRKGKKHPQQAREEAIRKLKTKGVRVEWEE